MQLICSLPPQKNFIAVVLGKYFTPGKNKKEYPKVLDGEASILDIFKGWNKMKAF
jgi:hypothetical protein